MVNGVTDKIVKLFKTTTTKYYSKPTYVNHVYWSGKKPSKAKIKATTRRYKKSYQTKKENKVV